MHVQRRRQYLHLGEAGGRAQALQLASDGRIAAAGRLRVPERAERLLGERLARPEEQAVVLDLAQVQGPVPPQHPAGLAQDRHHVVAGDVLQEPRRVHGVEGAIGEGQGGGGALHEGDRIAQADLGVACGAQLVQGEVRADQLGVGKARAEAAGHRARAAGQIEQARRRADLDSVEDPAGEEAGLGFETRDLGRVGLAVNVARHAGPL